MKKINNNLISLWLIALTLFLTPSVLEAKHIVGGEITYKFISGDGLTSNRYQFTMRIYRDGNTQGGAQLDPIHRQSVARPDAGWLVDRRVRRVNGVLGEHDQLRGADCGPAGYDAAPRTDSVGGRRRLPCSIRIGP